MLYIRFPMNYLPVKYSPVLLLIVCLLLMGSAPPYQPPGGKNPAKNLTKDYVFVPGGMEGDSVVNEFYISAIEVTNRQYRDFITDLIDSGATAKLKVAMVDSSQWKKSIPAGGAFVNTYFRHPAYDDYPVVNISKAAAELYCEWLTERYNRHSRPKAHFALPTETQWQYAARGGNAKDIYPWPGNSLTYERRGKWYGTNMCNYRTDSSHTATAPKQTGTIDITAPSRSYMPNTYDIYNMGGNVAEMIEDQDYTKGGSYLSRATMLLITAHEDADLSHGWPMIGFRPVMIIESGN